MTNTHIVTGCGNCPVISFTDSDPTNNWVICPFLDVDVYHSNDYIDPNCPLKTGAITIKLSE